MKDVSHMYTVVYVKPYLLNRWVSFSGIGAYLVNCGGVTEFLPIVYSPMIHRLNRNL